MAIPTPAIGAVIYFFLLNLATLSNALTSHFQIRKFSPPTRRGDTSLGFTTGISHGMFLAMSIVFTAAMNDGATTGSIWNWSKDSRRFMHYHDILTHICLLFMKLSVQSLMSQIISRKFPQMRVNSNPYMLVTTGTFLAVIAGSIALSFTTCRNSGDDSCPRWWSDKATPVEAWLHVVYSVSLLVCIFLVTRNRNGGVRRAKMAFGLGALAVVVEMARAVGVTVLLVKGEDELGDLLFGLVMQALVVVLGLVALGGGDMENKRVRVRDIAMQPQAEFGLHPEGPPGYAAHGAAPAYVPMANR